MTPSKGPCFGAQSSFNDSGLYMCVSIHVCIYTKVCMCMCAHACTLIGMYMQMYTCILINKQLEKSTYIYIY